MSYCKPILSLTIPCCDAQPNLSVRFSALPFRPKTWHTTSMRNTQALKRLRVLEAVGVRKVSSDQMTPRDLAIQMVNDIPQDKWNTKILVPGSGYGTFALALVYAGWDASKITCVEIDPAYAFVSKTALEPFGVRVIVTDFLEWCPKMKFDVIIGNPPYSLPKGDKNVSDGTKNLALMFIEKSVSLLKEGGYISMITPFNFLKPTDSVKPTRSFSVMKGLNLVSINTGIERKWFPKVATKICSWVANKGVQGKLELNGGAWDLNETPFVIDLTATEAALFKKVWTFMKSGSDKVKCRRVGDGNIEAKEGWSLTERVNRRKLSETLWSTTSLREKYEQIHISLPPSVANEVFSQPHVKFFIKATDVEPTLYHNLLNGLDFGPINLTESEILTIKEFLSRK